MESFAFTPQYNTGYSTFPSSASGNMYDYIFSSMTPQYQAAAQQMAMQQMQQAQQPAGASLMDIGSAAKDIYSLLPDSVTSGLSDILPTSGLGSAFGATSPLMTGINSWAVGAMPSVFGNLGGGIGALATGSAGGNVASLAAAESAAGLSSAGSTFTGMLGPAGILGSLGYMGGSMLWPDKPQAAIGSGIGTGLGALGGSMLGSSLGGAAASGAASAAATGAAAGSWAGPIGMGVGALAGFLGGGLLGGAFGGKKGDPSVYTKINVPFTYEDSFKDAFAQGSSGASGAKASRYSNIYNSLGYVAQRERDKVLRQIDAMEDQDVAAKLKDALSKENIAVGRGISAGRKVKDGWGGFSWNFEVSHNDMPQQMKLAKDDVREAVKRAYDRAKQAVGYVG